MPNGVRRNNNTRHSNRHRQEPPDIVIAEVFDSRVIIQGEHVDVDEVTELRRELLEVRRSLLTEKKDNVKLLKQSKRTLEEVFERLKHETEIKDKLADRMVHYEGVIQHLEDGGFIEFKNQTKDRRLLKERTIENMIFVWIHDLKGNEIPFKDIHKVLQGLEDKNKNLKVLCEKLIKQSLSNGGSMKIIKEPNKEVEVSVNHDESGEISGEVIDNNYKEWSWKGVDYRIDLDNKQVFDMDGRQVGETIGKIPTLWDKWWEELD
jgi:hypothetical protein